MNVGRSRRNVQNPLRYGQIGDLEKARKAQGCALEVIELLAEKITDETLRNTLAAIAHSSLKPVQARPDLLEIRFRVRTGV
jgi:hypothetical protein